MKKTWNWWLFTLLELLFCAVFPLVIVYLGYGGWGEQANTFKVYFGVLIALIIVFWIVKKVLISPWLEKQKIKAGNLDAQLETETDTGKIANIESALKRVRFIETVCSWVLPLAVLLAAFLASRAMEKALVEFSGVLGFIGLSELVGFVFACLLATSVKSRHK